MKNKYYTPEIEEFRVGFEYEAINIDNAQWGICKCTPGFGAFDDDKGDLEDGRIRVRYLDEEDILSLRFKNPSYSVCTWYELEGHFEDSFASYGYWTKIRLVHCGLDNKIKIVAYEYSWDAVETVIFAGAIKNISELKVLLKQLNLLPSSI